MPNLADAHAVQVGVAAATRVYHAADLVWASAAVTLVDNLGDPIVTPAAEPILVRV